MRAWARGRGLRHCPSTTSPHPGKRTKRLGNATHVSVSLSVSLSLSFVRRAVRKRVRVGNRDAHCGVSARLSSTVRTSPNIGCGLCGRSEKGGGGGAVIPSSACYVNPDPSKLEVALFYFYQPKRLSKISGNFRATKERKKEERKESKEISAKRKRAGGLQFCQPEVQTGLLESTS